MQATGFVLARIDHVRSLSKLRIVIADIRSRQLRVPVAYSTSKSGPDSAGQFLLLFQQGGKFKLKQAFK